MAVPRLKEWVPQKALYLSVNRVSTTKWCKVAMVSLVIELNLNG